MSDLNELYQETILEHNKNPRNFREIVDADQYADGKNPLCGDALRVYIKMDGDTVTDVAFKGSGCAISKASASMTKVAPCSSWAGPNTAPLKEWAIMM